MTPQTIINDRKKCVQDSDHDFQIFLFRYLKTDTKRTNKVRFCGVREIWFWVSAVSDNGHQLRMIFQFISMDIRETSFFSDVFVWEFLQMVLSEKGDEKVPTIEKKNFCGFR